MAAAAKDSVRGSVKKRHFIRLKAASLLLAYVLALWIAQLAGVWPELPKTSIWELQDTSAFFDWLRALTTAAIIFTVAFIPIGAIIPFAVDRLGPRTIRKERKSARFIEHPAGSRYLLSTPRSSGILFRCCRFLCFSLVTFAVRILVASLIAALIIYLIAPVEAKGSTAIIASAVIGCLFGIWCGSFWRMGFGGRVALAVQALLLLLLIVGGGTWLAFNAVADKPFDFEPPRITSSAKREVVARLRHSRDRAPDRHRIYLAENDANFLLAWGLSLGSPQRKARVQFGDQQSVLTASLGFGGKKPRYFNITVAGQMAAEPNSIHLRIDQFSVGDVKISPALVQAGLQMSLLLLQRDAEIKEAIDRIEQIRVDAEGLLVTGQKRTSGSTGKGGSDERGLIGSLLTKLGDKPDVAAAVREHVSHLLVASKDMPKNSDERFRAFVATAFQLASKRSRHGDAATENRAAILALGILLGHRHIEKFVGEVTDESIRQEARTNVGNVTIRGRQDWTRHFTVSAAIALLSSDFVSDAAGLLKEELDADGGSGFSFADLAADRAGTLFADAATSGEKEARMMQQRLANGFEINDLFPQVEGLPEGIPDAVLQSEYGGVDGPRYQELTERIEQRLRDCKFLGATGK